MAEVEPPTKKRKVTVKSAGDDVENIVVSPVVRRTRRSGVTKQVSRPITGQWTMRVIFIPISGCCYGSG